MIDDWLVIFAAIALVLTLPLALNFRGAADRMAQANRRKPPRLPTMLGPGPPLAYPRPGTDDRTVRRQAILGIIAAVITIVIGLM